ncbi:hypothetical protein SEPCBS119000_001371 [Sporothrix epigloea]|uniref:Survival motor neuron Tudor domain-containing protein n=1 Tax=Sporothrix epigloea TaxID=1892477 RepID=A0ABP0DAA3_9PEZI
MIGAAPAQKDSPWDESAIIKSWDRVVGDYKSFLQVHLSGGCVADLPASLQSTSNGSELEASLRAEPEAVLADAQEDAMDGDVGSRDADTQNAAGALSGRQADASVHTSMPMPEAEGQAFSAAASDTTHLPAPSLLTPQTVLGGADENLKKLLMSWYYAGYYTGLHEGQQQAGAVAAQPPESQQGQAQANDVAEGADIHIHDSEENPK